MIKCILLVLLTLLHADLFSQRITYNFCDNHKWYVWLDEKAEWQNDKLLLPEEVDLSKAPHNPPTCGWDTLYSMKKRACFLPTSIEEQFGTSHDWTYHGVSWFYSTFFLSDEWDGKRILLDIGKYNHRIEIYINEKLVGYDAIGLLPYQCDVTSALSKGENRIALRVTSAGGNRGWEDYPCIKWGNEYLLPDKDFSGIGGDVILTGIDQSYVSDIFVKNLLPAKANNIEVEITLYHTNIENSDALYSIIITEHVTENVIFEQKYPCILQNGRNVFKQKLTVPEAKQWSEQSPNLYSCKVVLQTKDSKDVYSQNFGFRVFEVKKIDNRTHFYLNGKRIRLRSSIDWGIYAFNGLFPTKEVAKRSIEAVKLVGHNSLNFHRRAGDVQLMNYADSIGVFIYEEPGGFRSGGQGNCNIEKYRFAKAQIYERLRRMVIRDRNHPSLLIYSLCNEDNNWTEAKKCGMELIRSLDPTRLIINSSGGNAGGFSYGGVPHIRPYEDSVRRDYYDNHTVKSLVALNEADLNREQSDLLANEGKVIDHVSNDSSAITYWGEVRCYAGTFNVPLMYQQGSKGYDLSMYESQAKKVKDLFMRCNIKGMGNGEIQSEYDLTRYAGQGQYYSNGRLGQVIMSNDFSDGYAINGWSPGPDMPGAWFSAMLDLNRNMNSYKENISYWNRPLQIAIMRTNGKYINPGDSIRINAFLINEGILPAGKNYSLKLRIKDGRGRYTSFNKQVNISVKGGDTYAQTIMHEYPIAVDSLWTSGYITIEGELYRGSQKVADGIEQLLLKNRLSQKNRFRNVIVNVLNWPSAEKALKEANVSITSSMNNASLILMGSNSSEIEWEAALKAVKLGTNMVVQFDSIDAEMLYKKELINTPITEWGGVQTSYWNGNGSSYIDVFAGDQVVYKSGIISTRSWEACGNPRGFYPFESNYKLKVYGLYFAHQHKKNSRFKESNNTLVTYGEIEYGKGKILLNSSYWVDNNNAFSDLLFFNIIDEYVQ